MEPVGALASAITIVGLTRTTAKFVKALRGIASENGTVASEIHRMATRIQTSATSIDIALEDLKSHSSTLRRISITPSKILQHMIDNKSLQTIVSGTQSISNQMRDKAQELKQLKNQPNLYKKLKWCIWDKMEVESLFPEMQLVAFMLEKSPGEVAQCLTQEMAYLRGQLKMVEKQFQALVQEQHSSIGSEFEAEFYATAKPLLRLARSVRRTGTVPETRRKSPSRRASASEEIPLSIHREVPPVLDGEGTREMPRRTRRKASLQSARDRSFNSAPPSQTPRPSSGMTPSKPQSLSVPREAPSEVSRHSSGTRESSSHDSDPPSPSSQIPDTPLTPQSPDIPEAPKPLSVDTLTNEIKTANQFGLKIQELDPDEPNPVHDERHEIAMHGPVIAPPSWPLRSRRAKRSSIFSERALTLILRSHAAKMNTAFTRQLFDHDPTSSRPLALENSSTIDLPDDDPSAVRMMIEYLYRNTYTPPIRDDAVDSPTSTIDNNEEKEKRKRDLCDSAGAENKRAKRPDALPEDLEARSSQPAGSSFGAASTLPPPPPAASQEPRRGPGQDHQGFAGFGRTNSAPVQNAVQASLNQSSTTSYPNTFGLPAPAPAPAPPPRPSAPQRPVPPAYLHLHTKVYAIGEKYGIELLKALALSKFRSEVQNTGQKDDFLAAIREAYTSTIETDRPLRDAVVAFLRSHKHLLKKKFMKKVLKETDLGFDLLMELASE
ncbi:hypothetical protein F52700_11115 [Fusarium sp. NRRL 52700]|nr:hypothetical protein F52700_11115 [Fusarium sp. NRRL 52700]